MGIKNTKTYKRGFKDGWEQAKSEAKDAVECADYDAEMVEDNQGDWVEHDEIQSHLRLLAEAVLEAHFQIATSHKCQCPACKVAREVMG